MRHGCLGLEKSREPSVNGRCSLAGQLLKDDRAGYRREVGQMLGGLEGAAANRIYDDGELGIGLSEMVDGASVVHRTKISDWCATRSASGAYSSVMLRNARRFGTAPSSRVHHKSDIAGLWRVTFGAIGH